MERHATILDSATVVFVGQAASDGKLAKNYRDAAPISLSIEVDVADERVVDVSCVSLQRIEETFLRGCLIGRALPDAITYTIGALRERMFSPSRGSCEQALLDVFARYEEFKTRPGR
ncbi:DUF3870 domain-containing protein [Myxococcota bacterium]|nr:DUF3870 domain-containing protein [Myxococcota bacterium]